MSNKNYDSQLIDIREDDLLALSAEVLDTLLRDHTTGRNIFWATHDYEALGSEYGYHSEILPHLITDGHGMVIRPRVLKAKEKQTGRIKRMAEVFTPSWVCNIQNNLVTDTWFGRKGVFNVEDETAHSWKATAGKIIFPKNKTWKDYVLNTCLEITCGEAPYLTSRYDTTTGEAIPLEQRIGLLDRKLRVVSENTETTGEWLKWAQEAYKSTYGYEWQGDSLLLARENLLYTFIDFYTAKFGKKPLTKSIRYIAYIISWNLWQMDGLKFVVPDSCKNGIKEKSPTLFDEDEKTINCEGCQRENRQKHNGIYCFIKDWKVRDQNTGRKGQPIRFVDILKDRK